MLVVLVPLWGWLDFSGGSLLLPCGPQILRGGQGPSSVRGNEGLNSQAIEGAIKPSFFIWVILRRQQGYGIGKFF